MVVMDAWENILRPGLKNEPWSEEEEQQLADLVAKYGTKWSEIDKVMNRGPRNLYNKWTRMKTKKEQAEN